MELRGERIIIKPLELDNCYSMRLWGYHGNPLISDYNFPNMTDKDIEKFYKGKTSKWNNKYFGIFSHDGIFIGYLGVKNIRIFRKVSYLGLVFDPNFVSKGYGTDALGKFLEYYFTEMKMKRMYLEVSEFNKRAYRLYENMGFKPDGYYLDLFFDQKLDLHNSYFLEQQSSFVISNKKIYTYIYRMRLDKDEFKGLKTRS